MFPPPSTEQVLGVMQSMGSNLIFKSTGWGGGGGATGLSERTELWTQP